ncbi:hypothetical protein ACFVYP_27370 [Kitasatospora sp. NPDC058201]|uniref:hypothetical protein n=1 Tax=unclassified Kitasatospora TaxID=2633591 RepID=UPI003661F7BF
MDGQSIALTAQPAPDDDAEPATLAPQHLRRLQQLAANRAARQANQPSPAFRTPTPASSADLAAENERLRAYVAVLEAAVTVLLDATPPAHEDDPATAS